MSSAQTRTANAKRWVRSSTSGPLSRFLVVLGLYALGIGQPVISMLGENPELFVFHNVSTTSSMLFVVAVSVAVPILLWVVGEVVFLVSARAGQVVHLATVAMLGLFLGMSLIRGTSSLSGLVVLAAGVATGAVTVLCYVRWEGVRSWSRYLAILPAVALLSFWLASPTGDLLRSDATAAAAASRSSDPSVVVLLLDELPTKSIIDDTGGVSATRFPNLARLAEESDWYPDFTVPAPLTMMSVPSLLTSAMEIDEPGLHTNYPDNLFSMLDDTHELRVFESFTKLCAAQSCEGEAAEASVDGFLQDAADLIGQRLSPYDTESAALDDFEEELAPGSQDPLPPALEGVDDIWTDERPIERTTSIPTRFTQFLDTIEEGEAPTLHFLHLVLPHQPWRFLPDGSLYSTPLTMGDTYPYSEENEGEWLSTLSEYRHLLQAQSVDGLVGDLIDRMKATETWDDSLVIVLSDHGMSFEPGNGVRTPGPGSFDSVAYSPLFIKRPGQATGETRSENVLGVDLVPTVADIVGVEPDFDVEGLSVDDPAMQERDGTKWIHDVLDLEGNPGRGLLEFQTAGTQPRAQDRWIGKLAEGADPIEPLNEALGISHLVGHPPEVTSHTAGAGRAVVERLEKLETPDLTQPEALVVGRLDEVDGVSADAVVLLVVDGQVTTGSPIIELGGHDSAFAMFLPLEHIASTKTLEFVLLDPDGMWQALETSG